MNAHASPFAMARVYLDGAAKQPEAEQPIAAAADTTATKADADAQAVLTCRYHADGSMSFQFGEEVRVLTPEEVGSFKAWLAKTSVFLVPAAGPDSIETSERKAP